MCEVYRLELPDEVLSWMLDRFYPETGTPVAAFHPKFIVEHSIASCAFDSVPPRLTLDLVKDAVENLVIRDRPGGKDNQSRGFHLLGDEEPAPSQTRTTSRDIYQDVGQLLSRDSSLAK
jgi:hypothetical protein